jgi:hypothetical protein
MIHKSLLLKYLKTLLVDEFGLGKMFEDLASNFKVVETMNFCSLLHGSVTSRQVNGG